MVRVTLQPVSITDSPIANAVNKVNMICLMYFFIVVVFIGSTIIDHYLQLFLYINQKCGGTELGGGIPPKLNTAALTRRDSAEH